MSAGALRSVQWTAWAVLLIAFAVFLLLVLGGPYAAWRTAEAAREQPPAELRIRAGNANLQRRGERETLGEGDVEPAVLEGAEIRMLGAGGSKAFLRFFDESTLDLEGNGSLRIDQMQRPRFAFGSAPRRISLRLEPDEGGAPALLRAGTKYLAPGAEPTELEILTPRARVTLAPDTRVRLRAEGRDLRVWTDTGEARVEALDPDGGPLAEAGEAAALLVRAGERTRVREEGPPDPATSEPENLVANADFARPPARENGWQLLPTSGEPAPRAEHEVEDGGRTVLRLRREGSEGRPGDLVLTHDLYELEIEDASYLSLEAVLRIDEQSLPGGGDRGEEFPLILTLVAETVDGTPFTIPIQLYAVPPDPEGERFQGAVVDESRDVLVPLGEWTRFESGNLRDGESPWARGMVPSQLERLEIKASGHDFDSRLDSISLFWK